MSSVMVEVLISSGFVLPSSVFVPLTSIVVLLTSASVVSGVVVPYAPLVIKDELSDIVVGSGVVVVVVSDIVVGSGVVVVVVVVSDIVVGSGVVLVVVVSDIAVGSGVVLVVVSSIVVGSGVVVVVVSEVVVKYCWVCASVVKEIVCVVTGSSISQRQRFLSSQLLQVNVWPPHSPECSKNAQISASFMSSTSGKLVHGVPDLHTNVALDKSKPNQALSSYGTLKKRPYL